VLGVLTLVYFGLQRVGGMSDRFFASTLDGANGLVRYLVGDYIGAAHAYRAHYGIAGKQSSAMLHSLSVADDGTPVTRARRVLH